MAARRWFRSRIAERCRPSLRPAARTPRGDLWADGEFWRFSPVFGFESSGLVDESSGLVDADPNSGPGMSLVPFTQEDGKFIAGDGSEGSLVATIGNRIPERRRSNERRRVRFPRARRGVIPSKKLAESADIWIPIRSARQFRRAPGVWRRSQPLMRRPAPEARG
jgi:hypothetical protein